MNHSIDFFDRQFRGVAAADALKLNPFEEQALPYLHGEVLDFGCGMGNLACAAAARGCRVTALDASRTAIEHVRQRAHAESLAVDSIQADLSDHPIDGFYDSVVSIGLLMFFDCAVAWRVLDDLLTHVRPGGCAVINVLIEGTTYRDMFDPQAHCLFDPLALLARFEGWAIESQQTGDFEAPGQTVKRFLTVVARRPPGLADA